MSISFLKARLSGQRAVHCGALALLVLLSAVFFRPVYESWSFFVPPVLGAVLACLTISVAFDWLKVGSWLALAGHAFAFALVIPGLISLPEARFALPLPSAIASLGGALINGPALLLTSPIPARSTQELLVVPVFGVWVGLLISWLLVRRSWPQPALVGPAFVLTTALLFGP